MQTRSYRYTHNQWSESFDPKMDSENTLILLFFESEKNLREQLKKIKQLFPLSKIIGASTAGEIHKAEVLDQSITCMMIKFDHTRLKVTSAPINFETSAQTGKILAENLAAPDLKNILLLSEGLDTDGSDLIRGLDEALKKQNINIPISGGMAADGYRFTNTYILHDTSVQTCHAVALGLYGEQVQIFSGTGTGWSPFGPSRVITKARGKVVYEIDGQPALEIYKQYFRDDSHNLPDSEVYFPLGIDKENLVRSVKAFDEENGALVCVHTVPENTHFQLMHSNVMKLIDAADKALDNCTLDLSGNTPTAVLIVSCVGRRMIMGQKTEDEIDIIKERLPDNAEICGFYCYGEFAPTEKKHNKLHNQTMTLIIFQERA